jgi:iron(III) transport system substrate-binding protein
MGRGFWLGRLTLAAAAWLASAALHPGNLAVAGDGKASWQLEWEKTLQAARQEGQVTLYASSAYEEVFREFQKRYPEIRVNFIVGTGGPSAQRILSERRAGKNLADLYLSGAATGYNVLYKGRVLDPIRPILVLPEVTDESKWWRGKHKYMDDEKMYLFAFNEVVLPFVAYNNKMVNPAEFSSYWDLLNPKWKGRIAAMDPTMGSAVDTHLVFIISQPALGPNYLSRLLAEMDITASRDARQIVDWLGSGRYAISLFTTPSRADLNVAKDQGLPVDWLGPKSLKEGTGTSTSNGNVGLINRAPHPNAAKVAINWLLTREGQIYYQKAQYGSDSLRVDIPKNQVAAYARRQEGVHYIETDAPERRNMEPIRKIIDEVWKRRK